MVLIGGRRVGGVGIGRDDRGRRGRGRRRGLDGIPPASVPEQQQRVRLDAYDEPYHEEEDLRRGARVRACVHVERDVEQPLKRVEEQQRRVHELVEEEAKGRRKQQLALLGRWRYDGGHWSAASLEPRPRLEEGRFQHFLYLRRGEGVHPLLVGEELEQEGDAQVGGGQVGQEQLRLARRKRRPFLGRSRPRPALHGRARLHLEQRVRIDSEHIVLGLDGRRALGRRG